MEATRTERHESRRRQMNSQAVGNHLVVSEEILDQKRRVQEYFDASEGWQGDMYYRANDWFARSVVRRKKHALTLVDKISLPANAAVLDVGCGSGAYLEELAARGFRCFGVDASERMVEASRNRLGTKEGMEVKLYRADVEQLPFDNESFDLVLSIGVIGYLLDENRATGEIRRILRPGGYWVVEATNAASLSNLDFLIRRKILSVLNGRRNGSSKLPPDAISVASPWVEKHSSSHHQYRLYYPLKFEQVTVRRGFRLLKAITFAFQLRFLRRFRYLPAAMIDELELRMERLALGSSFAPIRYAGESYMAVFQKTDGTT